MLPTNSAVRWLLGNDTQTEALFDKLDNTDVPHHHKFVKMKLAFLCLIKGQARRFL
jgi:hypothetical protein